MRGKSFTRGIQYGEGEWLGGEGEEEELHQGKRVRRREWQGKACQDIGIKF